MAKPKRYRKIPKEFTWVVIQASNSRCKELLICMPLDQCYFSSDEENRPHLGLPNNGIRFNPRDVTNIQLTDGHLESYVVFEKIIKGGYIKYV